MTAEVILKYLSDNEDKSELVTIVTYNDESKLLSEILIHKSSQDDRVMYKNIWIVYYMNKPQGIGTLNGDQVKKLNPKEILNRDTTKYLR